MSRKESGELSMEGRNPSITTYTKDGKNLPIALIQKMGGTISRPAPPPAPPAPPSAKEK